MSKQWSLQKFCDLPVNNRGKAQVSAKEEEGAVTGGHITTRSIDSILRILISKELSLDNRSEILSNNGKCSLSPPPTFDEFTDHYDWDRARASANLGS
jgi:hypothetical protein